MVALPCRAAIAALGLFLVPAAAQTISVPPGPLAAGSSITIGFLDPARAGNTVVIGISDGTNSQSVTITLDANGKGDAPWVVAGWVGAVFTCDPADSVERLIKS